MAALALAPQRAAAEWRPPDLRPTAASLRDVLRGYAQAAGEPDARFAQRRERWTYAVGAHRLPVRVAVRGESFRASVDLGEGEYAGGRWNGTRWRADANGLAHATLSDDQGDAADRLPQSVFPFALADCSLAGESTRFGAAWVLLDRAPQDKPHWFYVDEATGRIVRETTREGARTIVTTFERFEPLGTMTRPRRWHVSDGDAAHDLDVTVDAIEPAPLAETDVAPRTAERTFAPAGTSPRAVSLPAHFRGRTIFVDVDVDGETREFVLDTGTASVVLDAGLARRRGWPLLLEHVTVPRMSVGALALTRVSTLALPLGGLGYARLGGILGYDFFAGHVVHVDYARERVEVLPRDAAGAAFAGRANTQLVASFEEGVPIVRAAFGAAVGDRFVLDTGSPHLYVLAPFAQRYASEAGSAWPVARFQHGAGTALAEYLEGSIFVVARTAPRFTLGPLTFRDLVVGVQVANTRADAIDVALDGIVGTDQMSAFEWWFDYDGDRIAVRRNAAR